MKITLRSAVYLGIDSIKEPIPHSRYLFIWLDHVRITSMKKFFKYFLSTLAALVLLAVVFVLYVQFGDLSVHRDRILTAASEATGFEITSDGPFNLEIGRGISLSAGNVVVTNPGWPDGPALATIGDLYTVVDTWSLVSGPIEVHAVQLGDADINLIESTDNGANWLVPEVDTPDIESAPPAPDPIVHKIALEDVRVSHQTEGSPGTRVEARALNLNRSGPNRYEVQVDVSVDQDGSSSTLATTGSLQFGASMSNLTHAQFDFDAAEFRSADTILASFSGTAAIDLAANKPAVKVEIEVSSLEVKAGADAQEDQVESDAQDLLFSTDQLSYSGLDAVNLVADIRIAEASIGGDALRNMHLVAAITDGALVASPVDLEIGDGSVSGSLELLPVDDQYTLNLTADIENLRLAQLADEGQDPATVPPLNASLSLTGIGDSFHDIMASSNGRFSGRLDSGQLQLQAVKALFSDFLSSIVRTLNPLAEEQTHTNLECSFYEIEIAEGIAEVQEMVFQSERLTIISSGDIDLGTEEIDLVMRAKTREGLGISVGGVSNSFVKLGGTLKEPSLDVDAAGTVTTAGAAVATGGLSVLAKSFWDRLSGEVDLCRPESSDED
ncbi:MAG: AsmA family protein [Gammaproteobacteria bacterium]